MADIEDEAPGWDAIDDAFRVIYKDQEPKHYGTVIKYMLGGPDPIDGISVYESDHERPHWHYVTYGFTELYTKESDNVEFSGWGFELTFRLLKKAEDEGEPPMWPIGLMQNLARYVFNSGSVFESGHYLDCQGKIALDEDTELKAIIFISDPEIPARDTPHGRVEFLQMVGITADELATIKQWNTMNFAGLLAEHHSKLLITELSRRSICANAAVQQQIKEGIAKDGSSTGSLFVSQLDYKMSWGKCELTLGALSIDDVVGILKSRIAHQHGLVLIGRNKAVRFEHANAFSLAEDKDGLKIGMSKTDVDAFANAVQKRAGKYKVSDKLSVTVAKTEIKDHQGVVVEVVG